MTEKRPKPVPVRTVRREVFDHLSKMHRAMCLVLQDEGKVRIVD